MNKIDRLENMPLQHFVGILGQAHASHKVVLKRAYHPMYSGLSSGKSALMLGLGDGIHVTLALIITYVT